MEKEMSIKRGLEENLKLIIENARDLYNIFEGNEEKRDLMLKFFTVATITLVRLEDGEYEGKEQAVFDAFMPVCAHLNKQIHKYNNLNIM